MLRWELKQGYEEVFGPIRSVSSSEYRKFTGSSMTRGMGKSTSAPELPKAPPVSRKRKQPEKHPKGSAATSGDDTGLTASGSVNSEQPMSTPDISRVPRVRGASRKRKASPEALSDGIVIDSGSHQMNAISSDGSVVVLKPGVADVVTSDGAERAGDERVGRRTRRRIRYS